jgi:hypothetical protein
MAIDINISGTGRTLTTRSGPTDWWSKYRTAIAIAYTHHTGIYRQRANVALQYFCILSPVWPISAHTQIYCPEITLFGRDPLSARPSSTQEKTR